MHLGKLNSESLRLCGLCLCFAVIVAAQTIGHRGISYADAKPILDTLKPDLLPAQLRALTPSERQAVWPDWVSKRDAEIRARLAAGDEDSVVTFLLFGVSFTSQPRYSFATAVSARAPDAVAADPTVQRRITDLVAGLASPGANERLQFARRVIERHGIDPTTAAGKQQAEQILRDALKRMLADYDTYFRDTSPGATLKSMAFTAASRVFSRSALPSGNAAISGRKERISVRIISGSGREVGGSMRNLLS